MATTIQEIQKELFQTFNGAGKRLDSCDYGPAGLTAAGTLMQARAQIALAILAIEQGQKTEKPQGSQTLEARLSQRPM